MSTQLGINCVFESVPGPSEPLLAFPHRVLWIDRTEDLLITIELSPALRAPVFHRLTEIEALLADSPPQLQLTRVHLRPMALQSEEDLPASAKARRDRSWGMISPLLARWAPPAIFDPELRGPAVTARAAELGVDRSRLYRLLFQYWAAGSVINGLLPRFDSCGPQGNKDERRQSPGTKKRGRRAARVLLTGEHTKVGLVMADIRDKLIVGIMEFWKPEKSLKRVWREVKAKYFSQGHVTKGDTLAPIPPQPHEAPSYDQLRRCFLELDLDLSITAKRVDTSTWGTKYRPVLGSSRRDLFGPGDRFEIDATIVDIYLVSSFNRKWIIGRPVLYVVIDVFSGMVVGFYLGLEGPSWEGARLALFNAFSSKVEFCRQYGVEISEQDWPCHHLPHRLLGDNGEMISHASDTLPDTLGITAENAAVRRGDWKPNVEQQFRLIQEGEIHFLPGAINPRIEEVRKRNNGRDACLTIHELTSVLIRNFIKYNRSHYREKALPAEMIGENLLDATPLSVWKWGMENLTGGGRTMDKHEVYTHLLPKAMASVRHTGIYFEGRHYSCPRAEVEQWYARVRRDQRVKSIEIRHDPGTPMYIWIRNEEKREWEVCHLLDKDEQFKHARLEEVMDRAALLKRAGEEKSIEVALANSILDTQSDKIVNDAMALAKNARAGMKKSQIKSNIDQHRALEKTSERVERTKKEPTQQKPVLPDQAAAAPLPSNVVPLRRKETDFLADIWEIDE